MIIKRFEDIVAWQEAKSLTIEVYRIFRYSKDYSFKDQIQRAAISVMNNIAEGYERNGNKEFRNFLYIAKGSCAEVRSMLYVALDLKYISQNEYNSLYNSAISISKMLSGLIKTL